MELQAVLIGLPEKQRVPQVGLLQKQVVGLMEQKAWLPEKEPG